MLSSACGHEVSGERAYYYYAQPRLLITTL